MLEFTDIEKIIIGVYLNGHVGEGNQGVERVNGRWRFGKRIVAFKFNLLLPLIQ